MLLKNLVPYTTPWSLPSAFLQTLAEAVSGSVVKRHGLFLLATLIAVPVIGYHFGTFDQAIHIPFLKKFADPTLFPGDQFLELRWRHYSYFWFFFQPFYALGFLETAMLIVHGLTTYATFWAAWTLSETLFKNSLASLLGVIALIFPHISFGAFPLLEFSLLNRTFVLPFLLWSITLYLRRRYLLAFSLLGLLYNLHVISVNFVLVMFYFDGLCRWKQIGLRQLMGGTLCFLAGACPVLWWRLTGESIRINLQDEWFTIITNSVLPNLFRPLTPYPYILFATFSGISGLILFFIARRAAPSALHEAPLRNFILVTILVLVGQVVITLWFPATFIMQFQIIRIGLLGTVFGYLYFAHYLARRYQASLLNQFDVSLLTGAFVISTTPILPLIYWAGRRFIEIGLWRRRAALGALLLTFVGGTTLAWPYDFWSPGIYPAGPQSAWQEAQVWARNNTPQNAIFITPPHIWGFYTPDWRVFSERSTVVTLSELLEAALLPDYIDYWKPRFESMAPGALAQFRGNYFDNREITAAAFYSLSSDELRRLARQYGATYLVVEKGHWHDLPIAYQNSQFVIYHLPPP